MKAPTGPNWIHEIKHDGFRIVTRRVNGVVRLQTMQGYDYAERYPLIVEAITRPSFVRDRLRNLAERANRRADTQVPQFFWGLVGSNSGNRTNR